MKRVTTPRPLAEPDEAAGHLLKAQARLGHRDPATTLRHYAHAAPLDDVDIADSIDDMLNGVGTSLR